MKKCVQCGVEYADTVSVCLNDGQPLIDSVTASDSLIGRTIASRFRILSKLGEGGMGAVYKAEHIRMNRICAIKILSQQMAREADALARFNREAQMSSRIAHPHAVTIYDFGEAENGLIYLAMEFVEGETLTSLLKREGPLPLDRTVRIARQIADALTAAHKLNIVHRDLKPDNIMLSRSEEGDYVKVLDFGIAKIFADDERYDLTKTGLVIGTPLYMSPEQLSGERLDARSDVYSLAIIVYQMLTGALPFAGENTQAQMIKRLTDDPLPIRQANPQVYISQEVERVLMAALARERNRRTPSANEFIKHLEAAAQSPIRSVAPSRSNQTAFNQAAALPTSELAHPESFVTKPIDQVEVPEVLPTERATYISPAAPAAPAAPGAVSAAPAQADASAAYPPQAQAASERSSSKLLLVAVAGVLLLALAGVAFFLLDKDGGASQGGEIKGLSKSATDAPSLSSEPDLAEAERRYKQGVEYHKQKRWEEAIREFQKAVEIRNDYPEAHENLGAAFFEKNDLENAVREFSIAINQFQESKAQPYYNRGLAYYSARRFQEAANDFQKAIGLAGNQDPELYAFYGYALYNAGKISEANTQFKEYLRLAPRGDSVDQVKAILSGRGKPPGS